MIKTVNLGDVFFVHEIEFEKKNGDQYKWCRIILPDFVLGWIFADNFRLQDIGLVHGKGKKDTYSWYDSLPDGNLISMKSIDDEFVVVKHLIKKDKDDITKYYKIKYFKDYVPHSGQTGWVMASDVTISFDILLLSAGRHLAKRWSDIKWGNHYDLNTAEKICELLFEKYPNENVLDIMDEYGGRINTGVVALKLMAQICIDKQEYKKAIKNLEKIVFRYPQAISGPGRAAGIAKNKIAEIYWKYMHEPYLAIEKYQEVIREYPGSKISGFEWSSTIDFEAMSKIPKIKDEFELKNEFMIDQYEQTIEVSTFSVIKVMAYIEKATILREQKKFGEAIENIMTAIDKYPSASMSFFKDIVHYSVSALDLLCTIYLEDLHDPEKARDICQRIYNENEDQDLARAAMFFKAELLDYSSGSKKQVINEYNMFYKYFHGSWGVSSTMRGYYDYVSSSAVQNRLNEIRSFKLKRGGIKTDSCSLFESPDYNAKAISDLCKGEKITALYTLSKKRGDADSKYGWYKITTGNGIIGWVTTSDITFVLKSLVSISDAYHNWGWPTYGANETHTRYTKGDPITNPYLRDFISNVDAEETVFWDVNDDGILDVIICGMSEKSQTDEKKGVLAICGKTQDIIWQLSTNESFGNSAPVIENNILYCCSNSGILYAVNLSTGTIKWTSPTEYGVSPVVYDTCLYIGSTNGKIYVINKNNGKFLWKLDVGGGIYGTPVIKNKRLYCGVYGRNAFFFCMDLNTKKILWTYDTEWYQIRSSPTIVGDVLLCGANDHNLYAINTKNGKLKWKYKTGNPITSSPAATSSIVCVTSSDSYVYAIDIATGKLLWKFQANDQFRATPCIVDNIVYAGANDGYLYAIRLDNGELIWKYEVGAPIMNSISAIGTLLCLNTTTNHLYFIGNKNEE